MLPAPKGLKKILHISYQQSKKQEAHSNNGHCKKDFPFKIAWNLIPSQGTDLLCKPPQDKWSQ